MRGKPGRGVHAMLARIVSASRQRHHQIGVAQAGCLEMRAPPAHGRRRIGQQSGAVQHQQRPTIDADIARVAQHRLQRRGERDVVLSRVPLRHQDFAVIAVLPPGPVLISPVDAERQVDLRILEQQTDRRIEQGLATKPVVMET